MYYEWFIMVIVDAICTFHKDYLTFDNRDWNSSSETNFSTICVKCSMKHYQILQARSEYLKYQTSISEHF